MSKKEIQKVFNKVIENGYYHREKYMCCALNCAEWRCVISEDESYIAFAEIRQFLRLFTNNRFKSLNSILKGTTYHREDGLYIDIYKDWFKFKEEFIKKYPPKGAVK